jgi:hypothetical protein
MLLSFTFSFVSLTKRNVTESSISYQLTCLPNTHSSLTLPSLLQDRSFYLFIPFYICSFIDHLIINQITRTRGPVVKTLTPYGPPLKGSATSRQASRHERGRRRGASDILYDEFFEGKWKQQETTFVFSKARLCTLKQTGTYYMIQSPTRIRITTHASEPPSIEHNELTRENEHKSRVKARLKRRPTLQRVQG